MAPASAQTNDSGSATGDNPVRQLIDEITREIERAEQERLADPWWLRDLRNVLARYDYPWQVSIFSDDFSGRGPAPDAPWKVTAGEMLIDWRHGLRSVIEPPRPQAQTGATGSNSGNEVVTQLFGQILQNSLGGQQGGQQSGQQAAQPAATYAAATLPVPVTNAFAMSLELSGRPLGGSGQPAPTRFEWGPYIGANAAQGYRLAYNGGGQGGAGPALELLRLSSRGTSTLFAVDQPVNLEDGQIHKIVWTRDLGGTMKIVLDGQPIMDLVDRSFAQPFDGLALVNGGGDFALRQLTIEGTP